MQILRLPIAFLLLALAQAACAIDTVPWPENEPDAGRAPDDSEADPDGPGPSAPAAGQHDRFFFSAPPIRLVGTVGAAPQGGTVVASNLARPGWQAQRDVMADGSFNLLVDGKLGDTVRLVLSQGDVVQEVVELLLQAPPGAGLELADAAGTPRLQVARGDVGSAEVEAAPGTLPAGAKVVLANVTRGYAQVAQAAPDGSLAATIQAAPGDFLEIFAVQTPTPGQPQSGGPAISVRVP